MLGYGEALECIKWLLEDDANDPAARAIFCVMTGNAGSMVWGAPNLFKAINPWATVRMIKRFPMWRARLKEVSAQWPTPDWIELVTE